jgi:DNA-binding transcriptional MerR regulator
MPARPSRPSRDLSIGQAARRCGLSIPTLRYYESIGLLPPARRRESGQRVYDAAALQRQAFIQRCREIGFPLDDIRTLADWAAEPERSCGTLQQRTEAQLTLVRERQRALRRMELGLMDVLARCEGGCSTACVALDV